MTDIIKQKMKKGAYQNLVIIGHSGGGTLAALLACEFPVTPTLITLAANLDIQRWAEIHSWSPLTGSQNPAHLPASCKQTNAYHFYGNQDKNVPANSANAFFRNGASPVSYTHLTLPTKA